MLRALGVQKHNVDLPVGGNSLLFGAEQAIMVCRATIDFVLKEKQLRSIIYNNICVILLHPFLTSQGPHEKGEKRKKRTKKEVKKEKRT
jgi:hypothetical protein